MNASIETAQYHGLPALKLVDPHGGSALVTDFGAHVVSWSPAPGDERLYMSDRAVFDGTKPLRGGIPVVFPQFGPSGPGLRHGFARVSQWDRSDQRAGADYVQATWRLTAQSADPVWPHPFELEYTVNLSRGRLDVELVALNPGAEPIRFTAALHTYLAVREVEEAFVAGLEGVRYQDQTDGNREKTQHERNLRVSDEVDRIYMETPRTLQLVSPGRPLVVEQEGFRDTVVWNPWVERVRAFADMPPDGFRRMICIEAATVALPVELAPAAQWAGRQSLIIPF